MFPYQQNGFYVLLKCNLNTEKTSDGGGGGGVYLTSVSFSCFCPTEH